MTQGLYLSVHHGRRSYEVGASQSMLVCHLGEEGQSGVIVNPHAIEKSAVAVVSVFAEAHIGKDGDLWQLLLDSSHGTGDDIVRGIGGGATGIFLLLGYDAEEKHLVDAEREGVADVVDEGVD